MNNTSSDIPKMATHPGTSDIHGYSLEEIRSRPEAVTKLLESCDHKFDYNLTKSMYYKNLRKILEIDNGKLFHKHWNKLLLNEKIRNIKTKLDTNPQIIYEVIQENGEDILIHRRKDPNDPIIKIISAEDCFQIILNAHRDTMHGNEASIRNKTKTKCDYPAFCIPLVLNSCNVCKEVSEKYTATECTTVKTDKATWKFMMHKIKRGKNFSYFFICTEVYTAFTLIRPIMKYNYEEVGMELYKIHRVFGTPQKILVPRNQIEFLHETLELFSAFGFNSIKVDECTNYLFDISCVVDALNKWSDETGSNNWAIGATVVQWKLNTSRRVITYSANGPILSGVPYNLFYGTNAADSSPTNDIVAEQLGIKFRNFIRLELVGNKYEVIDTIVNISSDESDTGETPKRNKNHPKCCVCKEEFVLYTCSTCKKFVHYKCGAIVYVMIDLSVQSNFVCLGCKK